MKIIKPYHQIIDPIFSAKIADSIRNIENCAGFDDTSIGVGEAFANVKSALMDGDAILRKIEACGRTCYKSENRITEDSAKKFVSGIIKSGHHSVIEHVNLTVRFVCDRGTSHEIVRHRLASYSQESTRYCRYTDDKFDNQITVILPMWYSTALVGEWHMDYLRADNGVLINGATHGISSDNITTPEQRWINSMLQSELHYFELLNCGERPEQARSVLPNSLKTEVVMTCNLREWKHVFRMRCQKAAHPQIREIMLPLLKELHERIPVVFDEEYEMFKEVV